MNGENGFRPGALRRGLGVCFVVWLGMAMFVSVQLRAQDLGPPPGQAGAAQPATGQLVTLHGVVRNASTGEPLPRALVRIEGDADTGALTDGEGRFEIPDVATGPQAVEVIKPGFLDEMFSNAGGDDDVRVFIAAMATGARNVVVAAEMPDVVFAMSPTNAVRGQIQLSTGDSAQGVEVTLLQRTVMSGRFMWQVASTAKANSDGVYRFAGLADGMYAICSNPTMDSEAATNLVAAGRAGNVSRSGYASQFYPDARDLAGAAKMRLKGGEQAEADLTLTLEPFHGVTAVVVSADGRRSMDASLAQPDTATAATVMDGQGRQLPYVVQYDAATHTVQASLPDGTYSMLVTVMAFRNPSKSAGSGAVSIVPQVGAASFGQVDFAVAGHSISNLRIPLSPIHSSPVQVSQIRSGVQAANASSASQGSDVVNLVVSQTGGGVLDGMMSSYAEGPMSGPLNVLPVQPGSYWVHTNVPNKAFCEGSLTAGGANLAREPLVIGLTGPAAPLSLALRSDCASLTLSVPATMAVPTAGEEPYFTAYVVPDFDTTQEVIPQTLRASTGGTVTLDGLTPGNYHVYTFTRPVELAYRNVETMAALQNPGQAVTLSPGAKANVVVEAPEQ